MKRESHMVATSRSLLSVFVACMGITMFAGFLSAIVLTGRDQRASAQQVCNDGICDFSCTVQSDSWFGDSAHWLILHAKPRLDGTSTDIRWQAASSSEWPILHLESKWEYNGSYHSATMTIDEDGNCVHTDNPDGLIRCHKPSGQTPPDLCDGYGGDWGKIGVGNCLSEVIYGFDLKLTAVIGDRSYCWHSVSWTPDDNPALYGRSASNCSSANLDWSGGSGAQETFGCTEDWRPGGLDSHDEDVYYYYEN